MHIQTQSSTTIKKLSLQFYLLRSSGIVQYNLCYQNDHSLAVMSSSFSILVISMKSLSFSFWRSSIAKYKLKLFPFVLMTDSLSSYPPMGSRIRITLMLELLQIIPLKPCERIISYDWVISFTFRTWLYSANCIRTIQLQKTYFPVS